ncbi:multidrug efflux SMR transporter [Alteromonas pelagimontana]|uniref:Guanidinium exporter n=1 Tax=Alteromonas pelagimontana TaxID=1858656 RepID=A0A6M4MIF6_9ALTE|nr:multidrug efflux SMR transporter [Alteromonas pelagimontana]QJR82390.1 multidrug efflux SMR transporter [Alteromonas pelagimontana]
MAWIILFFAGISEVAWAAGLKYADGFTKPLPSALTLFCLIISFLLLGLSLRTLPLGVAYGVWVGIGAVGTAIAGIVFFHESVSLLKLASIGLILLGVIGLKLAS